MSSSTPQALVVLVTDSTASIPAEIIARYNIVVVNLHVLNDGKSFEENREITGAQVVELLSSGQDVVTSQPSQAAFVQAYEDAFAMGAQSVVVALISSALSGTYSNAVGAAQQVNGDVRVIESMTTGMALGLSVVRGARLASKGADADEVEAEVNSALARSGALFLVDSLDYLRRGGRLSATAAALGTVLGLKPVLSVQPDGTIGLLAKVRSRKSAVQFLVDRAVEASGEGAREFAVLFFGSDVRAKQVCAAIKQGTGKPVFLSEASAVLGVHVGPGMLAVTFA